MDEIKLPVTAIQRFCMHDGPGIRTTVFLAGCPLRCKWCHNPETQSAKQSIMFEKKLCIGCGACFAVCKTGARNENGIDRDKCAICGKCAEVCPSEALKPVYKLMSISEIVAEVKKDAAFYGENGGVTVSGGEPMVHPEKTLALLETCKKEGIGTAVETCGQFDGKYVKQLSELCDIILWDVKDTDDSRHRENTGVGIEMIHDNLRAADGFGAKTILRCVLLKGVNLDAEHLARLKKLKESLANCEKIEFMPYHILGIEKGAAIGVTMDFHDKKYIPTDNDVNAAYKAVGEKK